MRKKVKFLTLLIVVLLTAAFFFYRQGSVEKSSSLGGAVISIINPAGQLEQVYLEDFVVQAVAAEMPISFGKTALKAQAVAARTYIAAHVEPYGQGRHEGAAVCCDSHHCQAYATIVQLKKNWRENFSANWALVRQAVADTAGEVLFYQQKIAETPYYSCCGGSTEAAADCWGGDRPYLQAKFCNYCAASPKLVGVTRLTVAEAAQKLAVSSADIYDMYIVAYTDGGRVGQMMIGGKLYGGAVLRSALALPSAAFSWLIVGENILFTSLGFGHGVGLCQYGAAGMAALGADYRQILAYYYPGCQMETL